MTDLTIVPKWNAAINRLETNEFATGGADGNLNIAPRQLAENVFWLKADVDTKLGGINTALSSKANSSQITTLNEKNVTQDTAISQNTTDISGLSVIVSGHTTAISDLQSNSDISAQLAKIRVLALAGL